MFNSLLATMLAFAIVSRPADLRCTTKGPGLEPGPFDVTAVDCQGRAGFFVPSQRYRDLSAAEENTALLSEANSILDQEATHLEIANAALVRTASAADRVITSLLDIQREDAALRELFVQDQENAWYEHPAWVAVAAVEMVLVVLFAVKIAD